MTTAVTSTTHTQGTPAWLASQHGTDDCDTIVLDYSTFAAGDHDANGYIPSGIVLGKITATGLYGPYDLNAVNGLETAVGHLYNDVVITGTADVPGALFWHGEVDESALPDFTSTDGDLDAAAKVDLAGQIKYV